MGHGFTCIQCSSVLNIVKEVLQWVLTISAEGCKKLLLSMWKVRCIAVSWSPVCPSEIGNLMDISKLFTHYSTFIHIHSDIHASMHYAYVFPTVLVDSMTYQRYFSWRYIFVWNRDLYTQCPAMVYLWSSSTCTYKIEDVLELSCHFSLCLDTFTPWKCHKHSTKVCLCVCLSVCLFVCPSVRPSVHPSVCLSLSVNLSVACK